MCCNKKNKKKTTTSSLPYLMFLPLKSCLASDSERVSSKALDVKCDGLVQLTSEGDLAEPRQCLHRDHCVLCKFKLG